MKFEQITVILNRGCPRSCAQCGIADNSRKAMSIERWIEAIRILKEEFGAWFFLFLGTEPLLFGHDLVTLIKWFHSVGLYYGFYSTSPEPMFTKYRDELVAEGLRNWSAGIDGIPGETPMDAITEKKVRESLIGLKWMAARGVETHTLTTVHKYNVTQIPRILEWLQDEIPGVQSSMNFIEYRKHPEMDFFSLKSDMADLWWSGSDAERETVRKVLQQVKLLSRVRGRIIQTVDAYLDSAHLNYDKLDVHCQGHMGPSIDADGTMRLCGYSTGKDVKEWSVFDIPGHRHEFLKAWMDDLNACQGCLWHYVAMVKQSRILNPKSGIHQERWRMDSDEYRKEVQAAGLTDYPVEQKGANTQLTVLRS